MKSHGIASQLLDAQAPPTTAQFLPAINPSLRGAEVPYTAAHYPPSLPAKRYTVLLMYLTQKNNFLLLHVKVIPNSSRTHIAGILGAALKIKVAQPPEAGRANRAVEALIADRLGLPPSQVSVIAGHTHPQKTLQILGISLADAAAHFDVLLS